MSFLANMQNKYYIKAEFNAEALFDLLHDKAALIDQLEEILSDPSENDDWTMESFGKALIEVGSKLITKSKQ